MHRQRTPEEAVDAVSDAIRELSAAAANLAARLPENVHQQRAVRTVEFEVEQLNAALPQLRSMLSPQRDIKAAS